VSRVWSDKQDVIFDFATSGTGNAVIEAVAGSGKSTTVVEAIRRVIEKFPGLSTLFLAFGKRNADDLKARGVNARTFHSLCFSPVLRAKKIKDVTGNKMRDLVDARFGDREARMYGPFLLKLLGLGKNAGIGCLLPDTEQSWVDLADHHNLELDHEDADFHTAIKYASELLHTSNTAPSVDFDDLLYLAVKDGISLPKFDFIVVDEYQDTNAIQVAVLRKIMHAKTRVMMVGDRAQAIYGFRGAESDSMDKAVTEFNAVRLPLTVTYRCPTAVVKHAHQWVKHIEAAPGAIEGSVESLGDAWSVKQFVANDLVICRTTAPLIGVAYKMLKARIPVQILGKDIGEGLKSLIKRMNAKGIPALEAKIQNWRAREVEKARAKKDDAKMEQVRDKADCLIFLIDTLPETARTIPALIEVIDGLFADKKNVTILSTIHKAKGSEAKTVYWLNSSKCPARWATQQWQRDQEVNLCYVACTRSKEALILIEEEV
jgi:DNA helicase-2/ATP-dependent DNA helicase PcrA